MYRHAWVEMYDQHSGYPSTTKYANENPNVERPITSANKNEKTYYFFFFFLNPSSSTFQSYKNSKHTLPPFTTMSESKKPEEMSPEEMSIVAQKFNQQQRQSQAGRKKIAELDQELQDHILVLQNLEPLDAERRCFRLIGGVLVERTVGEVRPKIEENKTRLLAILNTLAEQLKELEDEIATTKVKYAAYIQDDKPNGGRGPPTAAAAQQQGVLA